ncbi:MAG: hypothetical protein HYU67_01065, partial [Flavobacteriia bacterium]|nr:hypothetical protein [Flavobacteriia bacterium]
MKTPLIFLLLINLLYLTAQEQRTTFFTRYDTIPMSWTQAIDYENNFLRVYSSSPIGFSVIEKLDNKGTSLSIDSLTNYPRNSYFPKLIKTNNGYVIAFSSMTNILENDFMDADIKVQFYDENLYLLLDTTYISLYEDRFVDIIQTNDNGFLILSNKNNISVNPIEKSLNLTKINAQGEIVWEKEMVTDAKALLMNEFNTSTILIISENIDNFERYFTQIDENGNILNEISYTLPLLNTPTDLIQHNENELLLIGSYKKGNDNSLPRGVILKIDTIGNILDSTFYMFDEATEFKKIIKNHKNNYCIIGAKGTASYVNESNYYRNSFFLEMDTSGEILWSKEFNYSSNAQRTILNSLKQTSDNGYILTGNIRILPSDILYSTYKLDCNACDSISCYFKDSICNPADCIRYQNDNLFSVEVDSTQLVNNVINIDLF